jgi:hypothetical protein
MRFNATLRYWPHTVKENGHMGRFIVGLATTLTDICVQILIFQGNRAKSFVPTAAPTSQVKV